MNTLAQLLAQYDQQGLGAPYNTHGDSPWSGNFSRTSDAAAQNGARTAWAQSQLARQENEQARQSHVMPDYFTNMPYQSGQYREPERFGPPPPARGEGPGWRGGQYVGNQGSPQGFTMGGPPGQPTIQNYLAMLLKGR